MKNPESNTNNDAAESKTGWESLSTENFINEQNHNFERERNINDKTGKERTFVQWDLYPKLKGETNEQYGARLKFMNQKTAEYEAEQAAKEAKSEYLSSEHGKKELAEEEKFDRLTEKVEKAIAEGRMSAEHGKALLERQLERSVDEIDGFRQDYEDSKVVGTPEEQDAYESWLKGHDAENQRNLQRREKIDEEIEGDIAGAEEAEETEAEETETAEGVEEPEVNAAAEETLNEAVDETPPRELDPEVRAWLEEEFKDLDEWAEKKKYSDARKAEVEEELKARAAEKQDAIDRERQAAIDAEMQAATDEEIQTATETEAASDVEENQAEAVETENDKEKAKKLLIDEILSLGGEIEELEDKIRRHKFEKHVESESERIVAKEAEKAAIEAEIAAIDMEIATVDAAIEEVKKKKRPSFSLVAWISSRLGKNRRKKVKPVKSSAETAPAREATFDDAFENAGESTDAAPDYKFDLDLEDFPTFADFDKEDYHFWTSIGEKGLGYMTETGTLTDDREKEIAEWWDSLDDSARGNITHYKYVIGKPLRTFLQKKELIPEDTGDYFNEEKAGAKRLEERAEYIKREYDYWNAVGDEGMKYLTHEEVPNDENKDRVLAWWGSLDEEVKDRIKNSPLNRKLITWIQKQQEAAPEMPQAA